MALLKSGSAYYAPSASVVAMVDAIARDANEVLPVCAWTTGEYGISDVYVGVPARLGSKGVEEIVELDLNEDELASSGSRRGHPREVRGPRLALGSGLRTARARCGRSRSTRSRAPSTTSTPPSDRQPHDRVGTDREVGVGAHLSGRLLDRAA